MKKNRTIGIVVASIILILIAKLLVENISKIKEYDFSFNWVKLLFSSILFYFHIYLTGLVWKNLLKSLDKNILLSSFEAVKIVVYTRFGKYVPGKIWGVTGRLHMLNDRAYSKKTILVSLMYEMILSITGSLLLGILLLSASYELGASYYIALAITIVALVLFVVYQKWFYRVVNFLLIKINKNKIDVDLRMTLRGVIKFLMLYIVIQFINGISFFLLVDSFTTTNFNLLVFSGVIGAYLLSGTLGMLAFIVPAGIGVREGSLVLFLSNIFSVGVAVLISIVARLWSLVNELIIFVIYYTVSIKNKKKYE